MARKEMVITTCDSCGSETMYEYKEKKGLYIPRGWVHLELSDYSSMILIQDLCPNCSSAILRHAAAVESTNVEEKIDSWREKKLAE